MLVRALTARARSLGSARSRVTSSNESTRCARSWRTGSPHWRIHASGIPPMTPHELGDVKCRLLSGSTPRTVHELVKARNPATFLTLDNRSYVNHPEKRADTKGLTPISDRPSEGLADFGSQKRRE